jgi:hypothetical protein
MKIILWQGEESKHCRGVQCQDRPLSWSRTCSPSLHLSPLVHRMCVRYGTAQQVYSSQDSSGTRRWKPQSADYNAQRRHRIAIAHALHTASGRRTQPVWRVEHGKRESARRAVNLVGCKCSTAGHGTNCTYPSYGCYHNNGQSAE